MLHEFSDEAGGDYPMGGVAIDAQGNLYGTAQGGYYGWGVVWEITPKLPRLHDRGQLQQP